MLLSEITIPLINDWGHKTGSETVAVALTILSKKLAVHRSLSGKGWTVTHVPSGYAARTRIRRFKDAEKLLLWLEQFGNWDFRSPKSEKWQSQIERLKPLVDKIERFPYI